VFEKNTSTYICSNVACCIFSFFLFFLFSFLLFNSVFCLCVLMPPFFVNKGLSFCLNLRYDSCKNAKKARSANCSWNFFAPKSSFEIGFYLVLDTNPSVL